VIDFLIAVGIAVVFVAIIVVFFPDALDEFD
jgi:hypothetical protein